MGIIRAADAARILGVCLAKHHATTLSLSGNGSVPILTSTVGYVDIATLDHILLVMSSTIESIPPEGTHSAQRS